MCSRSGPVGASSSRNRCLPWAHGRVSAAPSSTSAPCDEAALRRRDRSGVARAGPGAARGRGGGWCGPRASAQSTRSAPPTPHPPPGRSAGGTSASRPTDASGHAAGRRWRGRTVTRARLRSAMSDGGSGERRSRGGSRWRVRRWRSSRSASARGRGATRPTWGMGGYDTDLSEATIREAWDASIDAGVTFFDTAEVYGNGESERIIGSMLAADRAAGIDRVDVVIATKFMPGAVEAERAARPAGVAAGLGRPPRRRRGRPLPDPRSDQPALARARSPTRWPPAHEAGLLKAVGVSNYSSKETRSIDARAAQAGPAPGHQPDRVLAAAPRARDRRPARHLRRARRRAARVLADRPGPAHRQVLGVQPAAGQARLLGPPDGAGRPRRRRAAPHRRRPRRPHARARSRSTGSSPRAPSPSRAPRTGPRPPRTPAPSAGSSRPTTSPRSTTRRSRASAASPNRFWQHG